MNEYEITEDQKREYIIRALTMSGFEEITDNIYACSAGDRRVGVDLSAGVSIYFVNGTNRIDDDDETGTLKKVADIISDAMCGTMPTKTQPDMQYAGYQPSDNLVSDPPHGGSGVPVITQQSTTDLTVDTIKRYINDKATDEEAYVFLQLCKARGLNPFLKEAHLIKYSHTEPATMVVGKDGIMKRAEEHNEYDGFDAGIIVKRENGTCEQRVGTFYEDVETLMGGWAKVYRKDHTHPSVSKVSMSEYIGINKKTGQPNRMWASKPATMIRKVAIVQAMREAFPSDLSGMYDSSEMGVEV